MWKHNTAAFQYAWLALESQQVIALRLMKLATGGPAATREAHRMVAEKVAAVQNAGGMVASAMARGASDGGSDAVVRMLRQRVRANRKRLGSGGPK